MASCVVEQEAPRKRARCKGGGGHLSGVEPGAPQSRRPSYADSPSRECPRRRPPPRWRASRIIISPQH
eukprot:1085461-Prymnesium_polylepis.1